MEQSVTMMRATTGLQQGWAHREEVNKGRGGDAKEKRKKNEKKGGRALDDRIQLREVQLKLVEELHLQGMEGRILRRLGQRAG